MEEVLYKITVDELKSQSEAWADMDKLPLEVLIQVLISPEFKELMSKWKVIKDKITNEHNKLMN